MTKPLINCKYFISILIGLFWSLWVLLAQFKLLLKHGFSYFKIAQPIAYPSCVVDPKYGKSCIKEVKTTKGDDEATTLKLHCVISGERNKETILMLHGFPEFWFSWRYQITEFSKTHRVIAMDMRGYGLSDKPSNVEDYKMSHLVNDVKGLLDSLEIPSVILVAHDWGGFVGWCFDNSYPEMVKQYITLNIPHPVAFKNVMNKSVRQFLKSWYISFFQIPLLPEWHLSRVDFQFFNDVFSSNQMGMKKIKLTADEMIAFKANMSQKGAIKAGIDYYRAMIRFPPSRLNVPKTDDHNRYMLIFGDADGAIEVDAAKRSKTFIPALTLKLLPGISHWVQQDDPYNVNKLMRDFINKVDQ